MCIRDRLKYVNESFPGLEWNEFLKNCEVNFYTSRKGRLWYSIRGKGYLIWISSAYPRSNEMGTFWLIDIEFARNIPKEGIDCVNELIEGATKVFDKMELATDADK